MNIQHACSIQRLAESGGIRSLLRVLYTAYIIQHTAVSIQHTAYSVQYTAYNSEHTALQNGGEQSMAEEQQHNHIGTERAAYLFQCSNPNCLSPIELGRDRPERPRPLREMRAATAGKGSP